jgi:hypothetical protein
VPGQDTPAPTLSSGPAPPSLVKKTPAASEASKAKKRSAKRQEGEDLGIQREIIAAKLDEAKRRVGNSESGGRGEKVVSLVVQVEIRKERYRGYKRMWEEMSEDDRYWYYVESEENKMVD